jgi:hypothetical protein
MWDTQHSCNHNCAEQLKANKKHERVRQSILTRLPHLYYEDVDKPVVFDKCRTWSLQANMEIAQRYIGKGTKTIIMYRPVDEIVISYMRLHPKEKQEEACAYILKQGSELLMRPLAGLLNITEYAMYVSYTDLIEEPEDTLQRIYSFIDEPYQSHQLSNIPMLVEEEDNAYVVPNMHKIRQSIERKEYKITLPTWAKQICSELNSLVTQKIKGEFNGTFC